MCKYAFNWKALLLSSNFTIDLEMHGQRNDLLKPEKSCQRHRHIVKPVI